MLIGRRSESSAGILTSGIGVICTCFQVGNLQDNNRLIRNKYGKIYGQQIFIKAIIKPSTPAAIQGNLVRWKIPVFTLQNKII